MGELRRMVESEGAARTAVTLMEAFRSKKIDYRKINLHEVATAFLGSNWYDALQEGRQFGGPAVEAALSRSMREGRVLESEGVKRLLETGSGAAAVNSSAFRVITSQIMLSAIWEGLADPALIGDRLCQVIDTPLVGPETIPGPESIKGGAGKVGEGQDYPIRGFGERKTVTPEKIKTGLIVQLTKELITSAQSGLANMRIMDKARSVGFEVRYDREVRILKVVLGIVNPYNENGTALNTYYLTGDTHPFESGGSAPDPKASWINKLGNNLVDFTDVNEILNLFQSMTDPAADTRGSSAGRRAMIMPDTLLVMPYKEMTALTILNPIEVRRGSDPITISASPIPRVLGNLQLVSSPVAHQLLVDNGVAASVANEYHVALNRGRAFAYAQVWAPTVTEAPAGHPDEFSADVVAQFKASEMGEAIVLNPRAAVLMTNA